MSINIFFFIAVAVLLGNDTTLAGKCSDIERLVAIILIVDIGKMGSSYTFSEWWKYEAGLKNRNSVFTDNLVFDTLEIRIVRRTAHILITSMIVDNGQILIHVDVLFFKNLRIRLAAKTNVQEDACFLLAPFDGYGCEIVVKHVLVATPR